MSKNFRRQPQLRPSTANTLRSAVGHLNAGRLPEAEFAVRSILTAHPDDAEALNLLAGIHLRKGNRAAALASLERAVALKPRDAQIQFNLAGVYRGTGDLTKAVKHYELAAQLKSGYSDAHALKGDLLLDLGDRVAAENAYQIALQYDPGHAGALNGVGLCALHRADYKQALDAFTAAVNRLPASDKSNRARILGNVAKSLWGAGFDANEALGEAIRLDPHNDELRVQLAGQLRHATSLPHVPGLPTILRNLFEHERVDPRGLASAAAIALSQSDIYGLIGSGQLAGLGSNGLLLAHLRNAPVVDGRLELALTQARRELVRGVSDGTVDKSKLPLICAIAQQCYLNEYLWSVSPEEEIAVAELLTDGRDWLRIAASACYAPLRGTDVNFDAESATPELRSLLAQQIDAPARELELAKAIKALTVVRDETSVSVRAQYEENPYPRWVRVGSGVAVPLADAIVQRLPHVPCNRLPNVTRATTLIAGCGTGLETINVTNAIATEHILAVDLSRASLGYASRKLEAAGITNVEHRQGDILELTDLGMRFDLVHSFGVIHHMKDPARGLKILADLLVPGGLLFLGLYSKIAREPVVAARQRIALRGITATPASIRGFRQEVLTRTVDPALALLASPASDFWTMSECRDLMFHVEEHQFTLLEIETMFAAVDVEFIGLEIPHPPDLASFRAAHPDPTELMSLRAWHAFEMQNPQVFGGTYRLWAQKRMT